jgi:hypothetical protein
MRPSGEARNMLDLAIVNAAIGLAFVYVLVSTACSAVREGLESMQRMRAAYLEHGIRELLQDKDGTGLAKQLFEHPLIYSLYFGPYRPKILAERPRLLISGRQLPSYISAEQFSRALLDVIVEAGAHESVVDTTQPLTFDAFQASLLKIQNAHVRRAVLAALREANGDLGRVQRAVEDWYNGTMDRVSGWYKRSTQLVMFVIALIFAGSLNINTLTIAEQLYRDKVLADAVVATAEHATIPTTYQAAQSSLQGLALPIGWDQAKHTGFLCDRAPGKIASGLAYHLFGLLLTALAAMLGAPFWFDLMGKFITLRSSLKPKPREAQEPSQSPAAQMGPAPQVSAQSLAAHDHGEIDGCDLPFDENLITDDRELPAARGGVA